MLSDRIFDSSVERAIPSLAAAPDCPKTRPWLSRKASSITSVSLAASINEKCGLHPNLVSRGCCESQLLSTEKFSVSHTVTYRSMTFCNWRILLVQGYD